MTNSKVLRNIEENNYKILINNNKITSNDREYRVNHLYLIGFNKAILNIYKNSLKGDIEFMRKPEVTIYDEVLDIRLNNEPKLDLRYRENLRKQDEKLCGISTPLVIKISENDLFTVMVNEKYIYRGEKINLNISIENGILNILIYPFKVIWLYVPRSNLKLMKNNKNIDIYIGFN